MSCDICGGTGHIRLTRRRPVSVLVPTTTAIDTDMEAAYREFACPECRVAETANDTHISVLQCEKIYDPRYEDEERFERHIRQSVAHDLVDELLRSGLIGFSTRKGDDPYGDNRLRARIGVVSPEFVKSMGRRATEIAADMLDGVADRAAAQISNWGSLYSGPEGMIEKGMAMRFVREAFRAHLESVRKLA